jgi:hypothetical protein
MNDAAVLLQQIHSEPLSNVPPNPQAFSFLTVAPLLPSKAADTSITPGQTLEEDS